MSIMIVAKNKDIKPWLSAFKKYDKNIDIQIYPSIKNKDNITFALVWSENDIDFREYKNLKCISSMGAGVNHIIKNKTIPKDIPITKIVDEKLVESMWEYLLTVVMNITTNHYKYIKNKTQNIWNPLIPKSIEELTIGILGLGQLGSSIAKKFNTMNFKVKGYSQNKKELKGIYTTTKLDDFVKDVDILINLLPLTSQTSNILNKELFLKLNKNAYIVNVGRGEHLVENDLIEMIKINHLSGAILDVFVNEPLEKSHLFWKHPNIIITPHSASITNPFTATKQIMTNYQRVSNNQEPMNSIDKSKGY